MAGMLDEIINYVQSLQNQVEVRLVHDPRGFLVTLFCFLQHLPFCLDTVPFAETFGCKLLLRLLLRHGHGDSLHTTGDPCRVNI